MPREVLEDARRLVLVLGHELTSRPLLMNPLLGVITWRTRCRSSSCSILIKQIEDKQFVISDKSAKEAAHRAMLLRVERCATPGRTYTVHISLKLHLTISATDDCGATAAVNTPPPRGMLVCRAKRPRLPEPFQRLTYVAT